MRRPRSPVRRRQVPARLHRQALADDVSVRYDWPRRLRNALLGLAGLDPGWMYWVEQVPLDLPLDEYTRIIERRARALLVKRYKFPPGHCQAIIYSDTPFSDRGNLLPG